MRVWIAWASIGVIAGCGYRAGSFSGPGGPFAGERAVVGCLDVAVAAHRDVAAEGPVIAYEFGNRCDRPVTVDLGGVIVRGRTAAGREIELAPYDPERALRPARLEARRSGREVIEYRSGTATPVRMACVEIDRLDGPGGAHRAVCVDVEPSARVGVAP
jgi:hypothetical protein